MLKQLLRSIPKVRVVFVAASLALVLTLATFVPAQPVSADPVQASVHIMGPRPNNSPHYLCFEVDGTTNGSLVRAAECNNNANQKFYADATSVSPVYRLRSYQVAGKCLDVSGASTASGAYLILYTCVPSAYEQEFDYWRATLRPAHIYGHTMCLTASPYTHGAPIVQQPCGQSAGQEWIINSAP